MGVLKRIGNVLSTVLVAAAVVLAIALVGVRLLGFEVYTVLSGSMEPAYHVGSLIWVDKCDASEVEVGDPITFVMNEDLDVATHRVIAIDYEDGSFTTQGDANDAPDGSPVLFENLIGVPVFTVPQLGYFVSYIQTPPGCYVALIVAAAVLALMFIPDLLDRADAKRAAQENSQSRARAGQGRGVRGVSVPKGATHAVQPGRPVRSAAGSRVSGGYARPGAYAAQQAGPSVSFETMSPQQRAYYAQKELERRRETQAPNQGIPTDSHRRPTTRRTERRERI